MSKLTRKTRKASLRPEGLGPASSADHAERAGRSDCALPRDEIHVNHANSSGHPAFSLCLSSLASTSSDHHSTYSLTRLLL